MMNYQNMEDRAAMDRIRTRLYEHVAELSARDYRAAGNPKRSRRTGERIHIPYALGIDTTEAMEVYKLAISTYWDEATENRIKAYQIKHITFKH